MAEESKARYAIVRVDKINHCPIYEGITAFCRSGGCDDCKMRENYGDTKKQLIEKVAQAGIKYYEKVGWNRANFQDAARFIVEFLGVE